MVTVSGKGGVRRHGGVQCISIVHAAARSLPRRPDKQPDMEMSVLTERNTIGPPLMMEMSVLTERNAIGRACLGCWRDVGYMRAAHGGVLVNMHVCGSPHLWSELDHCRRTRALETRSVRSPSVLGLCRVPVLGSELL